MKEFIKKIPEDIRQAAYSLCVAALLISGALFMLNGYLDTLEDGGDVEAMAPAEETQAEETAP